MTRNEVKKQIARGWLNSLAALAFLQVDLSMFDNMVRTGMIDTKVERGVKLFKLDDILAASGKTAKEVLDRSWPVDRRRKATRRQRMVPLKTQTEREAFNRKWFRQHRRVSQLIAAPNADIRPGELKLSHQLLALAHNVRSFDLVLTNKELTDATGLDGDSLPKARRGLEGRGLLKVDMEGMPWMYRLLDPRTAQPVSDDDPDEDTLVTPSESWADLR